MNHNTNASSTRLSAVAAAIGVPISNTLTMASQTDQVDWTEYQEEALGPRSVDREAGDSVPCGLVPLVAAKLGVADLSPGAFVPELSDPSSTFGSEYHVISICGGGCVKGVEMP
jgi:hypothetical protein